MYTVDTCPHVMCQHCLYYNIRADLESEQSTCKRIDHKRVKFADPWFASYTCGQYHLPCCDFTPKHPEYADFKGWTGFTDFWPVFVKAWLPYENENITLPFILNGNKEVRYYVPLRRFLYGTMISGGILHAVEKTYYKRGKVEHGVQLYDLIHEQIGGVKINTDVVPPDVEEKYTGGIAMGVIIHIEPEEIWQFFQKNKKRLKKEMVLIAENEETEYALYLSEDEGLPLFSVCKGDDEPEYEEGAVNEKDCADTAKQCCVKYLMPVTVRSKKKYGTDSSAKSEEEYTIESREWELLFAMAEFIRTATNDDSCADGSDYIDTYGADEVMEILDDTLTALADRGMPVYRPMMVDDDMTGEELYVEYPYNDPADFEDYEE